MTLTMTQPTRTSVRQWWALAVLMIPVLLVSIDNLVLSFALPEISRELQPTGNQLLWMVDIYALMLAGLLIAMGSLGDRLGRRRLLLVGAVGFGAVSVWAALSTSATHLIGARAMLGFFGAMLMPSTLSIIRNVFTDPHARRIAIATWAAGFAAGAALGPVLGGWLLEHYAWGSVFLVNVPLIAIFLPLAVVLLPESRDPNPGPLDPFSIIASMFAMTPIVWAIKHFASNGPDLFVGLLLGVGGFSGLWFVRRQRASTNPMVDLSLFGNRVFSGALLANGLSMMGMTGFLLLGTQMLQLVLGLSPMQAAKVLLPGLVVSMFVGFWAVRLVERFAVRGLVAGSFLVSSLGYVVAAFTGHPSTVSIGVAFMLIGLGVGIAETLTNDLILSSVPPAKAGAASALSETAYEIGAVLGTAVLGSVLTASYVRNLEVPALTTLGNNVGAYETLGSTLERAEGYYGPSQQALVDSAIGAFDLGAQLASGVAILLAAAAALVSWRALRQD